MIRHMTPRATVLLVGAISFVLPTAANATLVRNLKIGNQGEDVRELQTLLNRDQATVIAQSGPGSAGNETNYFGLLTRDAVIRLQGKYAATILLPLGITAPTGIVGTQTRLFLQQKTGYIVPSSTTQNAATLPPTVSSILPALVTKSTIKLTVAGTHFAPFQNTVIVSSEPPSAFTGIASLDGRTLTFTFHFTVADTLKKQFAGALASGTFEVVSAAFTKNIQQRTNPTGNAQIPVMLGVKNSNGESTPIQLLIDMTEILKEIGASTPAP